METKIEHDVFLWEKTEPICGMCDNENIGKHFHVFASGSTTWICDNCKRQIERAAYITSPNYKVTS